MMQLARRCLVAASLLLLPHAAYPQLSHLSQPPAALGNPPAPPVQSEVSPATVAPVLPGETFLNISSRENSRQWYQLIYRSSGDVAMEWSGSYTNSDPGTNSFEYLEAVRRRILYFRAMAGVPMDVVFNPDNNRKAQAAALIMGGNNKLAHTRLESWAYYSDDGAEGAANCNLSIGHDGAEAVTSQMQDQGAGNSIVGHRRYLLYPQTRVMGAGSVPMVGTNYNAAAIWVFDTNYWHPRPLVRDGWVCWPPAGYVPHGVVFPRWSISMVNADFTNATITMERNGQPLATTRETLAAGYGENTLVWLPAGYNGTTSTAFPRPAQDDVYQVAISNIVVGGVTTNVVYDVRVFDPSVPGDDYFPAELAGPAKPALNALNTYTFSPVTNAHGYQWSVMRLAPFTFLDGAEQTQTNFDVQAATNLYSIRDSSVKHAGTRSYRLAQPLGQIQTLTLKPTVLAYTNSTLKFRSRLGYATTNQFALVQISTDDEHSWTDIYRQAGSGGSGETVFTLRTVSLAPYAGVPFKLRFAFDLDYGSYFSNTNSGIVGWYLDDITIQLTDQVLVPAFGSAQTEQLEFLPTQAGRYLLSVQPNLFGDYPSDWGPYLQVEAALNTNVVTRMLQIQKGATGTVQLDFELTSGSPGTFEVFSTPSFPSSWTKETNTSVEPVIAGRHYRTTVQPSGTTKYYRIRAQAPK